MLFRSPIDIFERGSETRLEVIFEFESITTADSTVEEPINNQNHERANLLKDQLQRLIDEAIIEKDLKLDGLKFLFPLSRATVEVIPKITPHPTVAA